MGKASDWLREERRKVLGDWVAFCLGCGAARRWFDDFEGEVPEQCPQCGGKMLRRCPSCSAPFSSTFAVTASRAAPSSGSRSFRDEDPSPLTPSDAYRCQARVRNCDAGASAFDLREADHGHRVVGRDFAVVELAEERRHVLRAADLRVVVLDLPRRQL